MRELVEALRRRSVVLIVGAGVSAAMTRSAATSTWSGLVADGIDKAVQIGARTTSWSDLMRAMMRAASDDPSLFIAAASQTGEALRHAGEVPFSNWLEDTVGGLKPATTDLAESISALGAPILTTNYDTLLEQALDLVPAVWTDPGDMQRALSQGTDLRYVGHLHGVWNQPDSVILTETDYARLIMNEPAMAIQRALFTTKTVVYIGVGEGIADPNFARLLEWQRTTFTNPGIRNYRLCLSGEVDDLTAFHVGDNIDIVPYGSEHAALGEFLKGIADKVADADGQRALRRAEARVAYEEDLLFELTSGRDSEDDSAAPLNSLMIDPVLLPIPYADYVRSRTSPELYTESERIDPAREARQGGVLILAGEENTGLTFAAKWLATRSYEERPNEVPAVVPFTNCRLVPSPLSDATKQELRRLGYPLERKESLPSVALVLDNFNPFVAKISKRVLDEVATLSEATIVITCAVGLEGDVAKLLSEREVSVRVRYMGRLERRDVELLAKTIAPSNHSRLASSVLKMLAAEHLPYTPFTVGQLMLILLKDAGVSSISSSASILDQFVSILLGRTDPHEDARFDIDHVGRATILDRLAARFVQEDKAGLLESEVAAAIEQIIEDLSWGYSPTEVLNDLIRRRVLARRSPHIVFARGSYLHLFTAKHAVKSASFRDKLLEDPIYFAESISDYASLARHDETLLIAMRSLLATQGEGMELSEMFAEQSLLEPVFPDALSQEPTDQPLETEGTEVASLPVIDSDPPPFPVSRESDAPLFWQLMQKTELASRIIRDADEAGSLELKTEVFSVIMQNWGRLLNEMSSDADYQRMFERIAETAFADGSDQGAEAGRPIIDEVRKLVPAGIVFAAVSEALASRKLASTFSRYSESSAYSGGPDAILVAIYFLVAAKPAGWEASVRQLLTPLGNVWVVRNFVLYVLLAIYVEQGDEGQLSPDLLEACLDIVAKSTRYHDGNQRGRHRDEMRKSLQGLRQKNRGSAK